MFKKSMCRSLVILILLYTEWSDCCSLESLNPLKSYATLNEYYDNEPNSEIPGEQILMPDQAEKYNAVCIDGSVPDFYYRAGTTDATNKYHIYLEGGGWCASLHQCAQRTATKLGSSKYDQQYMNIAAGSPYLSSNQTTNPLTYNWNSVYIRYCDGSSYAGNNDTITKYNATVSLHFRGWHILNGVLNTLGNKYNLSLATDVLFSGCSAGGLGVYWHANYIYEWILKLKNNKHFNYMAMPDAGYFMQVYGYEMSMDFNWDYSNLTIGLDKHCTKYYNENKLNIKDCVWAFNIAPFIYVKMFSTQSQYDSNQVLSDHLQPNDTVQINQYGQNFTKWYMNRYINTNKTHYGFLVSCYQHCNFGLDTWNNISIKGYDISSAQINAWFDNTTYGNLLFQNYTYPCHTCC